MSRLSGHRAGRQCPACAGCLYDGGGMGVAGLDGPDDVGGLRVRAHALDEDTLARLRRVFGEDHPDTLRSAGNLAADLRALGEAGEGP